MNFLKEKYYEGKLSKRAIEEAYEQAQLEIENENYSRGLMAKAKSKSENNQNKAEALYLDLRSEQILHDEVSEKREKSQVNKRGEVSLSNKDDRIAFILILLVFLVLIAIVIFEGM